MDVVYLFKYSSHRDEELRYSLRSVAAHLPWIRKVWIFGDQPAWLTPETHWIEHVPHENVAWLVGCKTPVTNMFLLLELVALLPEVANDFLLFCDDYVLLDDLSEHAARRVRFVEDLDAVVQKRGTGLFREALWRTYDVLKRLNYPRLNYEVHVPMPLTKSHVLAAARAFHDFMTEDRFHGPLAQTSILNHARRTDNFVPVSLAAEASYAGFHYQPIPYEQILSRCSGKQFLNFDDAAFNDDLRRFLAERFPSPCHFEAGGPTVRPQADRLTADDIERHSAASAAEEPASSDRPLATPTVNSRRPPSSRNACVVLVPHRDNLAPGCAAGLRELEGRGYPVRRITSDAPPDVVRNQAASDAYFDGFAEFLWIAPNTNFHADQVERLRSHGLPLCSGVGLRSGGKTVQLQPLPGTQQIVLGQGGGLTEVLSVGAGLLHVQRRVYEAITHELKLPICRGIAGRPAVPWYQPLIRQHGEVHQYLSDDFAFCHRARAVGVPVIVDTTVCLALLKDEVPVDAATPASTNRSNSSVT